jgi:TolB-like protein/Flp pilus assembly protein TadD
MPEQSFFKELQRRKVVQAAAIYGAVAWGVTEIVVTVTEQLFLPQWLSTLAVIGFVVGFPVAMFLSWTFDITSDGIQRTAVSSRRGKASIVLSMVLLVAGTAGLFLLIKPSLDGRAPAGQPLAATPGSVAVLPFDYSGPNPDDSYLGPGLSDELRDQLGRVEGLQIAARSSSIAAVDQGVDARTMALTLGVAHLLEGNMRRQGNVLRVSVQLIDGASGLAVWQETFDRGRRELLNVQQDIAQAILDELLPDSNIKIGPPITQSATANEKMLLARHYEQQVREQENVDPELLERAVQLYREATELDPESALAHARLADALVFYGDIDSAEAPAYRALELNPRLAEAHSTYGTLLFARGRPNMGEPLARAVELNPNLPDALARYAFWHWFNVGTDGVADLYERALKLDPLNLSRYAALGWFLAQNDDYDGAREIIQQIRSLFDTPESYQAIAHLYDLVGDVDHSIAWTIKALNADPDNSLLVAKLAEYFVDIGDFETAEKLTPDLGPGLLFKMRRYDEYIDKAEELLWDYPEDIGLKVYLAAAYNFTGEHEQAVQFIRNAGLVESFGAGRRGTESMDAFMVLVNALYALGRSDELATLFPSIQGEETYTGDTADWFVALGVGCGAAIVGDDAEVYRRFERAMEGKHLPWDPMLKDRVCFKRFADDPAYLAVVDHFDGLRKMLRERLPETLAEYGINP